ncbi:hypothetical protein E2C01_086558 [Portunus trituberculatus]|uniref:Uncharacterized protein n=1 Tax=Portunus trituberculatus TaxID=210409 RepID=A0A5B7JA10_PORTR|nr:hypothetical protein [Portunus trituberculatus]
MEGLDAAVCWFVIGWPDSPATIAPPTSYTPDLFLTNEPDAYTCNYDTGSLARLMRRGNEE